MGVIKAFGMDEQRYYEVTDNEGNMAVILFTREYNRDGATPWAYKWVKAENDFKEFDLKQIPDWDATGKEVVNLLRKQYDVYYLEEDENREYYDKSIKNRYDNMKSIPGDFKLIKAPAMNSRTKRAVVKLIDDPPKNLALLKELKEVINEMFEYFKENHFDNEAKEIDDIAEEGVRKLVKKYDISAKDLQGYIWDEYMEKVENSASSPFDGDDSGRYGKASSKVTAKIDGESIMAKEISLLEIAAKAIQKRTKNEVKFVQIKDGKTGTYAEMSKGSLWKSDKKNEFSYWDGTFEETGTVEELSEWINNGRDEWDRPALESGIDKKVLDSAMDAAGQVIALQKAIGEKVEGWVAFENKVRGDQSGLIKPSEKEKLKKYDFYIDLKTLNVTKNASKINGESIMAKEVVVSADTFKCPDCGTNVLSKTEYCVKCKKKVKAANKNKKGEVKMNKEKLATVLNKIATALEKGEINNKQAKSLIAKVSEKVQKQGKVHTASALNNIIADESATTDTEAGKEEGGDDEAGSQNIQKAIQQIYKRKTDFLKIKNKRVKQVFPGLTGPDMLNMKVLPFIEMISNVTI